MSSNNTITYKLDQGVVFRNIAFLPDAFFDVAISDGNADGEVLRANRLLLGASSRYFRDQIAHAGKENFVLDGMSRETVCDVLQYVCGGNVTLEEGSDRRKAFVDAAVKLELEGRFESELDSGPPTPPLMEEEADKLSMGAESALKLVSRVSEVLAKIAAETEICHVEDAATPETPVDTPACSTPVPEPASEVANEDLDKTVEEPELAEAEVSSAKIIAPLETEAMDATEYTSFNTTPDSSMVTSSLPVIVASTPKTVNEAAEGDSGMASDAEPLVDASDPAGTYERLCELFKDVPTAPLRTPKRLSSGSPKHHLRLRASPTVGITGCRLWQCGRCTYWGYQKHSVKRHQYNIH